MRFFGNIFAWAFAALIAYGLASIFSTQIVLAQLSEMGAQISWSMRWETTLGDLAGLYLYGLVIAIGFAIAFFIASLVKAVVPFLSLIAYPVAAVAAVALALYVMKWTLPGNEFPITSAQTTPGFVMQLVAAAIGGVVFELCRPKRED